MDQDLSAENTVLEHKLQMIAAMDETIDCKKLMFKQLMIDIQNLKFEINQLEEQRTGVINASAKKSLTDCMYG